MTDKEREIYNYIKFFKIANGYAPTIQEMASGCYTSRTSVRRCLYGLCDKGYIKYNSHKVRSIVVMKEA